MNGVEFYEYLRNNYNQNKQSQSLKNNFTFCDWLYKPKSDTFSFRFNIINNNPKSIPQNIIISAWDANQKINDNWLKDNFDLKFHKDCRLSILNFLIEKYKHLR